MDSNITTPFVQKITRKDGQNIAYCYRAGRDDIPTLVFLGGYRSDMTGTKAAFLDGFCAEHAIPFLRFDYRGHGLSDGIFADLVIGDWLDDALFITDELVKGDRVLVGSSMGGWIGLLIAKQRGARIKGFIGIASAPDFTDFVWQNQMSETERIKCRLQGFINTPDGDFLTMKLFDDGQHHRVMDKPLFLNCPVTLLQGEQDKVVPPSVATTLAQHITSPTPPNLIMIPDGDHRLAREGDLAILAQVIMRYWTINGN